MKNVVIIIHLVISILVSFQTTAQSSEKPLQGNWTKGPSERFFGDVWVEYFINDSESDFLASRVLFEPKARSINIRVNKSFLEWMEKVILKKRVSQ